MTNKQYVNRILFIIFLTVLPLLIVMPLLFIDVIGWVLGSVASAINFYWLFRQTERFNPEDEKACSKNAFIGFNIRYLFLILWSIAVMLILKPNIFLYGVGLLNAQVAIFINTTYETIKNSRWAKYYRGNDDE
ncbi:MAG TPA: ATP synthase subunit I [Candidatus Cloacimonadota bacterium]|jgi:heme O synthase-like polyprenyltransferase|nr:ATP synthase subunit I [Candidatus Cloacimonadales bacterium]HPY95672.1 ATP synthase subunit I [Candidatus Cloacimonadota bacterium]HQB40344.1 ATP synthase subunit I [Candidatus Cloacimonadota bacterium]